MSLTTTCTLAITCSWTIITWASSWCRRFRERTPSVVALWTLIVLVCLLMSRKLLQPSNSWNVGRVWSECVMAFLLSRGWIPVPSISSRTFLTVSVMQKCVDEIRRREPRLWSVALQPSSCTTHTWEALTCRTSGSGRIGDTWNQWRGIYNSSSISSNFLLCKRICYDVSYMVTEWHSEHSSWVWSTDWLAVEAMLWSVVAPPSMSALPLRHDSTVNWSTHRSSWAPSPSVPSTIVTLTRCTHALCAMFACAPTHVSTGTITWWSTGTLIPRRQPLLQRESVNISRTMIEMWKVFIHNWIRVQWQSWMQKHCLLLHSVTMTRRTLLCTVDWNHNCFVLDNTILLWRLCLNDEQSLHIILMIHVQLCHFVHLELLI